MNPEKRSYMKISKLLISATTLLLLSCAVKDPIYNTPHPDMGKIRFTTDWSNRDPKISIPANYILRINADESSKVSFSGLQHIHPQLFAAGQYRLYIHHEAAGISFTRNQLSVQRLNPTAEELNSLPEWCFTGSQDVMVQKDNQVDVNIVLQQQLRELTLLIVPTGGALDKIAAISGQLSGVAGTLDIDENRYGQPSKVALSFVKDDTGVFKASTRLLGIMGDKQQLDIIVSYNDGSPANQLEAYALNALLSGFNGDKKSPLTLASQLLETPNQTGFSATIKDWIPIYGGNVQAN